MVSVDQQRLLTADEAALMLRCSLPTVYRHVRSGKLRAFRLAPHGPLKFSARDLRGALEPTTREPA